MKLTLEDRLWMQDQRIADPHASLAEMFLRDALREAQTIKKDENHRWHVRYLPLDLHGTFLSVARDGIWMIKNGYRNPDMKARVHELEAALKPYMEGNLHDKRFEIS